MENLIGIGCSIAAAFFWAIAVILYRKSGETIAPMALNLLKCLLTIGLLIPTLLIAGVDFVPRQPATTWLLLGLSGLIGITLADTIFFMALQRLNAGMVAVVDCLYLPFVMLLSHLFLSESIGWRGLTGGLLVCAAILTGASSRPTGVCRTGGFIPGLLLGMTSVLLIAASIIMVKELLPTAHVLWVSFVRMGAATLGLSGLTLFQGLRNGMPADPFPAAAFRTALPATFFGNYLAMLAWLVGMKYTLVSVAAILNQLSTVFIFILSVIFLKEVMTLPRIAATLMAVAGAILAATASGN